MTDEFNEEMDIEKVKALNVEIKEDTKKFLTFLSDGLTFAVDAGYVSEIITNYTITVLTHVPSFIKGIINLRGEIIPIIDIRERMHKPMLENTESSCIIVLDINSVSIGIFVDTVSHVVDVYESNISPMPPNSSQELVKGMMSLSKEMVILFLDCELLIQESM